MPNGYRRGGTYRRHGKTYRRRGAQIKAPARAGLIVGGAAIFAGVAGGSTLGSAVLIAGLGVFAVGWVAHRYRRQLRPVGRKLERWATKRQPKRVTADRRGPVYRVR
jgi:fatty acid desaturase